MDTKQSAEKKPAFKVKPADKKIETSGMRDKAALKDKARSLLMKNPEIMRNARAYFRNENGKTIPEETVPRGDLSTENVIYPRNMDDLTEDDLQGIAVFANSIMDEGLVRYDRKTAVEDALHRAIATKDEGRYAGKINSNIFSVLAEHLEKSKKK